MKKRRMKKAEIILKTLEGVESLPMSRTSARRDGEIVAHAAFASQDGIISCSKRQMTRLASIPAILKRPGRFDRVVHFNNPNSELRRKYYQRLNPNLGGAKFETPSTWSGWLFSILDR